MNEFVSEEARSVLERYSETEPHHAFRLKNPIPWLPWVKGQWYEGYIMEVQETTIVFCWAPSPFDDTDLYKEEFEIPINEINLSTLAW